MKEVLLFDSNNQPRGEFKPNVGFGKFSLFNQNPAFEFNANSDFLAENPIIANALK